MHSNFIVSFHSPDRALKHALRPARPILPKAMCLLSGIAPTPRETTLRSLLATTSKNQLCRGTQQPSNLAF